MSDGIGDGMSHATPPTAPPPPPSPHDKRTARKIPSIFKPRSDPHCRQCAFSLEGLPPHGKCPECGTEYDPSNSRHLLQAPSTSDSALYLLVPLLCAVGATIATSVACVTLPLIPACLVWFALRLGRFRTVMRERVLPQGAAVAPGVRSLGCAAMVLSRTILVAATMVTVASIVLLGWCVVAIANYRS